MYYKLEEIFGRYGIVLADEITKAKEYIKTLDCLVEFTCNVKRSKLETLRKFAESLEEEN